MLIRAGSVVLAPRGAKHTADVTSHVADNAQLSLAPEVITRRTTVKARKRDTVASVARRYRLRAGDVADWNDVGVGAKFKPGEAVVVYLPVRQAAKRAVASGPRRSGATGRATRAVASKRTPKVAAKASVRKSGASVASVK
jgi:membrane-bound lytic murein transglycosylase D